MEWYYDGILRHRQQASFEVLSIHYTGYHTLSLQQWVVGPSLVHFICKQSAMLNKVSQ